MNKLWTHESCSSETNALLHKSGPKSVCGTLHRNCTPPYPLYLVYRCVGTDELHPVKGSEVETSPVTVQRAVLFIGALCKTRLIVIHMLGYGCVTKTVILSVVGSPELTRGCEDIKWSDNCLVLSIILSLQLLDYTDMHTCDQSMNLTTDAPTLLKENVASNCHHHTSATQNTT